MMTPEELELIEAQLWASFILATEVLDDDQDPDDDE